MNTFPAAETDRAIGVDPGSQRDDDIAANRLLRGAAADLLDGARGAATELAFQDGEIVFDEDEPADAVYLILGGTVRISKRGRGGRQETIAHLAAGDFFGEMGLYGDATRSARATAASPLRVARIERADAERAFRRAPTRLSVNLLSGMTARLRETDARLVRQAIEAERLSLLGSLAAEIAHDLRNPLSVIVGAATMLEESATDPRSERMAELIRRSADRIGAMVREILDFSRGEPALHELEIEVDELVGRLEEGILGGLGGAGIHVSWDVRVDGPVWLDPEAIQRVVENLVRNAAEAMADGGTLALAIRPAEPGIVLELTDTGRGMPEEIAATLFEPWVSHGKAGGTGLGMAIVHALVEAHGGTIRVRSQPGVGTEFRIHLPRATPAAD
jgi:signal transduction histidine kinase